MQQVQSISVKASNNTPFGTLRRSNSCLFDEHGTKCHKQDHNNQCHYCWTDSTATLYWIRNEKSWKQYVAHRVDEIRKLTPTKVWRHCPGIQNPADLPSRGTTVQQLIESELWWRGPEFLKHEESQWPPIISKKESEQSALIEVVKQPPVVTHVFAATQDACPRLHVNRVIKIDTFSSLTKLLRVTTTVISFLNKLKLRLKNTE